MPITVDEATALVDIWARSTNRDPAFGLDEFAHGWFIEWPHHELMLGAGPIVIEKATGDIVSWGSGQVITLSPLSFRDDYLAIRAHPDHSGYVEAEGPDSAER